MEYPIFDFPFYHSTRPVDIKSIYPIGSIIFRSSPLADKTEWTEVSLFDSQFTVEWEGMTWELIVSIKPSDLEDPLGPWGDFHSDVHSIRNVRLQYSRTPEELSRGVCSAKMVIDDQSTRVFNLDTFTGNNTHTHTLSKAGYAKIATYTDGTIPSTMTYHGNVSMNPNYWVRGSSAGGGSPGSSYNYWATDLGGKTDNGNSKEYAYNLFMYKRIA